MTKNDKKDYNKIEARDNMKVDNNQEETMEVREVPEKIKPILSEAPKKRKKRTYGEIGSRILRS